MPDTFFRRLVVAGIFIPLFFATACRERSSSTAEQHKRTQWLQQANAYLPQHADSTVQYCDSVLQQLQATRLSDSTHMEAWLLKAKAIHQQGFTDSALQVLNTAMRLANISSDAAAIARLSLRMGEWYTQNSQYGLAERNLKEAIRLFTTLKKTTAKADALLQYGNMLRSKGAMKEAQEAIAEAIRIYSTGKNQQKMALAQLQLGNLLFDIGETSEAAAMYRQAITTFESTADSVNRAASTRMLGLTYKLTKPDSALYYYRLADLLDPMHINQMSYIVGQFNAANIYTEKREFERATMMYDSVLAYCNKHRLLTGIPRVYSSYALIALMRGDYATSEKYYDRARLMADSLNEKLLLLNIMKSQFDMYETKADEHSALQMLKKIRTLNDSLMSNEKMQAMRRLEKELDTERKDREYQQLQSELRQISITNNYRNLALGILAVATVILAFTLRYTKKLHREKGFAYEALLHKYSEEHEKRLASPDAAPEPPVVTKRFYIQRHEEELLQTLVEYFQQQKPYLNPQLKVSDVAEVLKTTPRNITAALKDHDPNKFSDLVNLYRVNEVKLLLEDDKYSQYTLEAIAKEAGFGSRQSLYNAFESITGVKLADYRARILGQNSA